MGGMEATGTNVPHVELLSRLRDLRGSWEDLDWKRCIKLRAEDDCLAYELVAGVFAISDGQGLRAMWLPSATEDGRTLERESLGIPVRDFAIDPTQDLIAILEDDNIPASFAQARHVRVHLMTISTNTFHPLAPQAILPFTIEPDAEYGNAIWSAMLQIVYDIVALFISKGAIPFKSRVLIWNWRQGMLIYDSEFLGASLPTDIYDFSLLSRSSFVLTSTRSSGALLLYSFSPFVPRLLAPTLTAILHLPSIRPTYRILKFSIHSGPFHAHPPSPPSNTHFSTSQTGSRINVLSVMYFSNNDDLATPQSVNYTLFVHNRTFLGYIDRHASVAGGSSRTRELDVDWESWGETHTRFIPSWGTMHWLRYVHGQRVIRNSADSHLVEVLDFNVTKNPRPSSTSNSDKPSRRQLRADPSCIYPSYLFSDSIVTRLPYYVTTRSMGKGQKFYACMIDEERLIGLKMETGDATELHVYAF